MNSKLLLAIVLLPALCVGQACYLTAQMPPPFNLNCSESSDPSWCQGCYYNFYVLGLNCYEPCPAGFKTLTQGYCVNDTIIQNHENFELCQSTTQLINSYYCLNPGPCSFCAPSCPAEYNAVGCSC